MCSSHQKIYFTSVRYPIMKKTITHNFNKAATLYDTHSFLSTKTACYLQNFINCHLQTSPQHIAEIGCGTGIFTQLLAKNYPAATIYASDISLDMILLCKNKFSSSKNIHFDHLDGENIFFAPSPDLITSNLTFHWFDAIQQSLQTLWNQTNKGLAFSFLSSPSLQQWFTMIAKMYPHFTPPSFLTEKEIDDMLSSFGPKKKILQTIAIEKQYASAKHFLKILQSTGTLFPPSYSSKPFNLKKVLLKYSQPFTISYFITFCLLEK